MWEKNALFENNCVYLLPSSDFHLASIVSVDQSPQRVFLVNTRSIVYIILNGRMALRRKFCVVFFNVFGAVEIIIYQRSLRS